MMCNVDDRSHLPSTSPHLRHTSSLQTKHAALPPLHCLLTWWTPMVIIVQQRSPNLIRLPLQCTQALPLLLIQPTQQVLRQPTCRIFCAIWKAVGAAIKHACVCLPLACKFGPLLRGEGGRRVSVAPKLVAHVAIAHSAHGWWELGAMQAHQGAKEG